MGPCLEEKGRLVACGKQVENGLLEKAMAGLLQPGHNSSNRKADRRVVWMGGEDCSVV